MQPNNRVLVFDIETAPMLAYVWGLHEQNVALNQLHSDWHVMAWAAKWLGEDKVIYKDQRGAPEISDDKELLKPLWALLDEADIVITQNGKSFDSKRLNARFIMHGMKPPKPYKHIDTYLLVRGVADFTSNKLEYLTDKLCKKYKKLSHKEFPGMELWKACLKGNRKAWDCMKRYNIHDVLSTEEFYGKIKAWAPQLMPKPFTTNGDPTKCDTCGKNGLLSRWGWSYTRTTKTQRMQCKGCGAWMMGQREKL